MAADDITIYRNEGIDPIFLLIIFRRRFIFEQLQCILFHFLFIVCHQSVHKYKIGAYINQSNWLPSTPHKIRSNTYFLSTALIRACFPRAQMHA